MSLTDRQQQAIPILISGKDVTEGCELAGVGRETFYRWMREDQEFADEYARQRRQLAKNAYHVIEAGMEKAATRLVELLDDPDWRNRRLAAQAILSIHNQRIAIDDLFAEIEQIKMQLANNGNPRQSAI